jgi:hypothetical protein
MKYQVIHHGPHTKTEGEHIHIGHSERPDKAGFFTEGPAKGATPTYLLACHEDRRNSDPGGLPSIELGGTSIWSLSEGG